MCMSVWAVCVYLCVFVCVCMCMSVSGYLGAGDKWLSYPKHWWLMPVILGIRKAEISSNVGGD
jgi:hypothetical protein